MVKKNWMLCVLILLSVYITGCSDSNHDTYEGETLRIIVIGETPTVSEDNIIFLSAEFSDLEENYTSFNVDGDALFIMPENLVEASNQKYIEQYNALRIPTFFIGTTKAHIPFVFEDADYTNTQDVSPKSYAAGYLYDSDNQLGETWEFSNESEEDITEDEIKSIYSDIFRTINKLNTDY